MTNGPLILSRAQIAAYLACNRRFALRYVERLPWPSAPLDEQTAVALQNGQQFHQLLERHFLNLPIQRGDGVANGWFARFQESGLRLPNGRRYPEFTLTVPSGDQFLTGRFDLLIIGENENGDPIAHIFDWKTGAPRPAAALRNDWQTRLYLAMLAEGGAALKRLTALPNAPIDPENIALTYWYAAEADAPRTIRYNAAWHAQNWADIQAIAANIGEAAANIGDADTFPLTDDWAECRRCAYQTYCDRETAVAPAPPIVDEDAPSPLPALDPIAP